MNTRLAISILLLAALTGCSNDKPATPAPYQDLRSYFDSVNTDVVDHTGDASYWEDVDRHFEEKKHQVESNSSRLNESERQDYEKLKQDYAALREKRKHNKEQPAKPIAHQDSAASSKATLHNALFGADKTGSNLSFINAGNVADVYERFVNTVDEHKESYSKADWEEIDALYKAMDARKDAIDKNLDGKDKRRISGLNLKYKTIKATNKPFSE